MGTLLQIQYEMLVLQVVWSYRCYYVIALSVCFHYV